MSRLLQAKKTTIILATVCGNEPTPLTTARRSERLENACGICEAKARSARTGLPGRSECETLRSRLPYPRRRWSHYLGAECLRAAQLGVRGYVLLETKLLRVVAGPLVASPHTLFLGLARLTRHVRPHGVHAE